MPDIKFLDDGQEITPPEIPAMKGRLWLYLLVITLVEAALNFLVVPVGDESRPHNGAETFTALTMGAIGAEAGLLALIAVFGPGPVVRRNLVTAFSVVALSLAWFSGYLWLRWQHGYFARPYTPNPSYYPEVNEAVGVLLIVPLMFCACELPLWIVRSLFHWQITTSTAHAGRRPQLSIAGMMVATAVVAICLAAVRLGHFCANSHMDQGSLRLLRPEEGGQTEAEWWFATGIAALFAGGISLAVLPIAAGVILRIRWPVLGVVISGSWCTLVALALVAIMGAMEGDWPPAEAVWPLCCVAAGFFASLVGPLFLFRVFGYRLLWGSEVS